MQTTEKPSLKSAAYPLFSENCDLIIISLALVTLGAFLNGIVAVYQAIVCVLSAVICEYIGFKLVLKKNSLKHLDGVMTGLVISLFLPACAPLWLGATACAFAVLVGTLPFGSRENAPFVPAVCGVCFACLCFPEQMFTYAAQSSGLSAVFSTSDGFSKGTTVLEMLSSGAALDLNLFGKTKILSGSLPGALGATSMLAMLGVLIYFLFRKPLKTIAPLACIVGCAAFAAVFPRVSAGVLTSCVLEVGAGTFVLAALLFASDSVTAPKTAVSAALYGLAIAFVSMLLRRYAKISDPSCFAVMIMNSIYKIFQNQSLNEAVPRKRRKRMKAGSSALTAKESEVTSNA
ncbi:MAG: RnfABCDGE type electron transport complex subunit D [Acutalibacteraceae bacterium]